jgi:hypothetical protein
MTDSDLRADICNFVNSLQYTFDKMYETTTADYNATHNYDMSETQTDTNTTKSSGTAKNTNNSTNINKATTYNSDTEHVTGGSSGDSTDNAESSSSSEATTTHTLTRSGNIGVTTTQQMLQSQRDLVQFDFIDFVAQKIAQEVCDSSWM